MGNKGNVGSVQPAYGPDAATLTPPTSPPGSGPKSWKVNSLAAPPDYSTLATIINPLTEIRKQMDEVLFASEYVDLLKKSAEIDAQVDAWNEKIETAKERIRECFDFLTQIPVATITDPTYYFDAEDPASAPKGKMIQSSKGRIFFWGNAGPYSIEEVSTKTESKDDQK